jgi:hypothetical protein
MLLVQCCLQLILMSVKAVTLAIAVHACVSRLVSSGSVRGAPSFLRCEPRH